MTKGALVAKYSAALATSSADPARFSAVRAMMRSRSASSTPRSGHITGPGAIGGWSFDGYGPLSHGYSKWYGWPHGSYKWLTQAFFRACVATVGCYDSWEPWIWSSRYATPSGWGWTWGYLTDTGATEYG